MRCLSLWGFDSELGVIRRMSKTLTIYSWFLLALGIGVSGWLYPHPLIFAPYLVFPFVIRAAHRLATRVIVLVFALTSVCVSFWFCWDAAFIHLSTMNLTPLIVALVEVLVAGTMWLVVRRVEKVTHAHNAV